METQLRILNSEKSFTAENEFYKGAVTWHIRFQGNIVHLKRKNIKGLAYIHKLLSHPNVEFYPNQLESDLPSKREDSKNITLFETFQSVDLNIRPYKSIIDDEEELLKALKRLTSDRPVDMDPESTPDLEGLIYHLAEELYVINALKNITSKKAYSNLYKDNKDKFDTACFLLRRRNSNPFITNTIIQKAKTIKTPHQGSSPSHKVKDRVGKAIRNSIEAMDSVTFQEYLAQTLSLGERCVFTPRANHPVDWQLYVS